MTSYFLKSYKLDTDRDSGPLEDLWKGTPRNLHWFFPWKKPKSSPAHHLRRDDKTKYFVNRKNNVSVGITDKKEKTILWQYLLRKYRILEKTFSSDFRMSNYNLVKLYICQIHTRARTSCLCIWIRSSIEDFGG